MPEIRVLLVDDHAMFRDGLRAVLERENGVAVVGEAGDGETAVRLARELGPHVVLLDMHLPRLSGVEAARRILSGGSHCRVIALTMYDDVDLIAAAIQAGVSGYVLKDAHSSHLVDAIKVVAEGGAAIDPQVAAQVLHLYRDSAGEPKARPADRFSARELGMLRLLASGSSNRDIGEHLCLSEQTVKNALSAIYKKLGAANRAEAVATAARLGVIGLSPLAAGAGDGEGDEVK